MRREMKCGGGIVILLAWLSGGWCADPVLTPEVVSDSGGNSANASSFITWAPVPSYDTYSAGNIKYDASGLTPLYNFAKSFINGAVFPYGIPWDLMEKAINGTLINDVTTNYMSYLRQFAGYGACVVIGFLFIFIFPLIGLCFCCCRCCCKNCGGRMMQHHEDTKADCKRRTFAIILFVLIAFTSAGMICVYLSNDQMSDALNNFDDTVNSNIDDLTTYISNTVKETKYVVNNNFNFTISVISRDLDNLGFILGIPIRTALKTQGKLDQAISSANSLASRTNQIASALTTLNTTLEDVKVKANILSSNLTTLKSDIDTALTAAGCPGTSGCPDTSNVAIGFNTNDFPDISGPLSSISSVESQNLTAIIIQAQSEIDNIPERVTNETVTTVSDMKEMLNNFSSVIDPLIKEVEAMQDAFATNGTMADIKRQVADAVTTASGFDKYRWYGGIGLTSIVLLVVLLQLLGLVFGTISQNSDTPPTDRGCMGSTAGNMLMASVGFVFIFAWLLMLLTTLTFIIGSPLERFVCQPLTDSSLNDLETLVDDKIYKFQYGKSEGYFLGEVLFNNASINITLKGLLQDCQAGGAAFKALKLGNLFDITTLTNFTKDLDIEAEVDKINIDLGTVKILSPDLMSQLNDLKSAINVNFTKFREELSKSASGKNLSALADELDTFAASCNPACNAGTQGDLQNLATRTRAIDSNELASLTAAMSQLQTDVNSLESTVNGTDTDVDNCINNFNISEMFVQTNGSDVVKAEAKNFASRVLGVVNSFVDDALNALDYEIGKCTPIWNLYNSLFVTSLCNYTIDTLNGFWFALGWCIFFFLPSIIFATKLAKHYRRMNELDIDGDSYDFDKDALQLPEVSRAGSKSIFGSNKVGHHDSSSKPPPYTSSDW
ncbi:prominin-1-like isoform X2 [Ostrea edulis]|uniref:prominin-1-like isoform X2 n=1 Tax=Ostrea edulis TaxID=37623 RepID=UPI0024AF85B5|nr:prominin-1-like isoform X2 [Ostrea edulis]XP_056006568.1 prominin-1-like isoform X2 [Ostrea edulis]